MRRSKCLVLVLVATTVGCQSMPKFGNMFDWRKDRTRSQSPDEESGADEFQTNVKTPMIGEFTKVEGKNLVVLQGVGLVTGLNMTGDDPPPSPERTQLLEDMKRRNVRKPNEILSDRSTALVIVRAYLPPLVKKGDHFDVEVRLPANSDATSLNGGWLMETFLSEAAVVPGEGIMKGHVLAKAKGPILISSGEGEREAMSAVFRRGRVLGGGSSLKDRDMALYLLQDFRNVRNSNRIAQRIGARFYGYDRHGIKEPLANPVTDQKIELKILQRYKDNFPRYLQVVRKIAFRESDQARHVRMEMLKSKLNDPPSSERAAIELEAIGRDAVPILKTGLKNPALEVQFHSAVALAYLEKPDGLEVLARAVREEPAFRVHALAAMSVVEEAESNLLLQGLLDEPSAETRYGAFRALTTMDEKHPFVHGENMNDEFKLHVLDTKGPPMVHLTTRKKAEVVLFGAKQRLVTPIAVQAGEHIQVTAGPGSDTVTVSRYQLNQPDRRATVSADLAEVIRTVASPQFGASYPDVAQLLFQASKQRNLASRLEIDALPEAGRVYYRPQEGDGESPKSRARVGHSGDTPNLFESGKPRKPDDGKDDEDADKPAKPSDSGIDLVSGDKDGDGNSGSASLADARTSLPREPADSKPGAFTKMKNGFMRVIGAPVDYAEPPDDLD
ncbi:MAG: flagellar basal body P-ring protein FlgI [Planctomycetaceae bacterium]